jgi:hypothetical protein
LPSTAPTRQPRNGTFEVHLFIRTIERKLPPPPDPTEPLNWPRTIGVIAAAAIGPLLLAALFMFLQNCFRAR